MKRKNTYTYLLMNPVDYKFYCSTITMQRYWENRINNYIPVPNPQIPQGHYEVVREGLLPYLARIFCW